MSTSSFSVVRSKEESSVPDYLFCPIGFTYSSIFVLCFVFLSPGICPKAPVYKIES